MDISRRVAIKTGLGTAMSALSLSGCSLVALPRA